MRAMAVLLMLCCASVAVALSPLVVNVSIPYEFESMTCVGGSTADENLFIAVQWSWLVAISPTTGLTIWNVSIADHFGAESATLGPRHLRVIMILSKDWWYGVHMDTGAILWKKNERVFVPPYDYRVFLDDVTGHVWVSHYRAPIWVAAVSIANGEVVNNVTLPPQCSMGDTIVAAHFPFALLRDDVFYRDDMRTECVINIQAVNGSASVVSWSATYNKTVTEYFDSVISGNCSPSADPNLCLITRQGWELQKDNYYSGFLRTFVASTGSLVSSHVSYDTDGCPIDGYTELSSFEDQVESASGTAIDADYPAGAVAMRCYNSNGFVKIRTNLVNVSNLTQAWSHYTKIPVAFDKDRVLLSSRITWAVVNQGNWVSPRSLSVDAYVTATGQRPVSTTASSWPLWFPDYMIENIQTKSSCSAGTFLAIVARNETLMDPYLRTLVFVTVV